MERVSFVIGDAAAAIIRAIGVTNLEKDRLAAKANMIGKKIAKTKTTGKIHRAVRPVFPARRVTR